MIEELFVIRNKLGLHARPAAMLVQTTSKFKSKIRIFKDNQEVDGKSIMGIMTLAASPGTRLRIIVDGEDEVKAIEAIKYLIETGFGEE